MTNETQASAIKYAMMLMSREIGAMQESLESEGLSEAGRSNLLNDISRIAAYRDEIRKLIQGCDCADSSQCWEPCGQLGNDEKFVKRHGAL